MADISLAAWPRSGPSSPADAAVDPISRPRAASASRPGASAEYALLRFVAGARTLLAALLSVELLALGPLVPGSWVALAGSYLLWATMLMVATLQRRRLAASVMWVWVDAAVLIGACFAAGPYGEMLGALTVLPVAVMSLRSGIAQSSLLAVACAAALGWRLWSGAPPAHGALSAASMAGLLLVGPFAALLARPSRLLVERLNLQQSLHELADPRQGLDHLVGVLLQLLMEGRQASRATLSLRGLQPRVFQRRRDHPAQVLTGLGADDWARRADALPRESGCLWWNTGTGTLSVRLLDVTDGRRRPPDPRIAEALDGTEVYGVALPLHTYGQPMGHLMLERRAEPFSVAELQWLHELMAEVVPLLERSDLLDQLQRETALRERERIGRDLHDSAVQPYLGLKYGLEALVRRATPDNPLCRPVQQLADLATAELESLRDVVSGLRRGHDATADGASLSALQRQAQRFEALFGLRVTVFAPQGERLRGATARAVLHMFNEALTNVRRHTSATAVTALLDVGSTSLVLRLRNDHGPGESLPTDFIPRSLTERAAEFAGSVALEHEANFTEITITLPLSGGGRS